MKYFYLLVFLTALCQAVPQQNQQPSPVYRSGPTVLSAIQQGKSTGSSQQNVAAEERESQVFVNPQEGSKPVNSGVGGSVGVSQSQSPLSSKPSDQGQTFQVYYYPPGVAGSQYIQQPLSGQVSGYQTGYQATTPVPESSNFFSNIKLTDVAVGVAALGLVGVGSALLYPRLVSLRARAMRELSEIKSDDAARMARSVLNAIKKYSELNNAKQE